MKGNILLIIEGTYPWYRGGVSEWVFQYLKALSEYKIDILQVATDEFQELDPQEALYPLTNNVGAFIRVSPPEITGNWKADAGQWISLIEDFLKDAVSGNEIIHIANTGFAGWLGLHLSDKYDLPLVLTEHAMYWKEVDSGAVALECGYKIPSGSDQQEQVVRLFKGIAKEVYQKAEEVISVSKINIQYQKELGAKRVRYIPNGIASDEFISSKKREDEPVIGWVGRCAEMKNPHRFLDLAEAFEKQGFAAHFLMLICDANEKELEESVRSRLNSMPSIEVHWNKEALPFFNRMDMLCITSHNESQPLVIFEALSKRALPVGWQVGDLSEDFGFVVDPQTEVAVLAQQLSALWENQDAFEAMITERFALARSQHSWEFIFEEYMHVFASIKEALVSYE